MNNMRKKIALLVSQKRQIPYRLRKSVIKKLYPSLLTNHKFEIDFYGISYQGNTNNNIDRLFFMFGGCQKHMLSLLRDYSLIHQNSETVFLDIGANVGNHSLFMSKYAKKIHAFEPNPVARNVLESHISLNKVKNIEVHACGLGDKNKITAFYASKQYHVLHGSFCKEHNTLNEYYSDLEVKCGDDLVTELGIKNIDIIKIDVEGYEEKVLYGLMKTIEKNRPMVIIEVSQISRNNCTNKVEFESSFPAGYCFYQFSGVNREKDTYKLTKFDYGLHDNNLDVIAVPKEKQIHFGGKIVKKIKRNKVVGG